MSARPQLSGNIGWLPIDAAPLDQDILLQVTDDRGATYNLPASCKLTASGWVSSAMSRTRKVLRSAVLLLAGNLFVKSALACCLVSVAVSVANSVEVSSYYWMASSVVGGVIICIEL
jgi:hypothetical protein